MDPLETIVAAALAEFASCHDAAALENAKARFLGKSGRLTEQLKAWVNSVPPTARRRRADQRSQGHARTALVRRREGCRY
jgi:phenylalanyl-tRNA synthetase alpha chain